MGRMIVLLALFALLAFGCVSRLERVSVPPDRWSTLDERSPWLRIHERNGGLLILSAWVVEESTRTVGGHGVRYDRERVGGPAGFHRVPLDSVVLFESNVIQRSPSVASMTLMTGISVAVTVACITNPKACFGSCPTFYVTDGAEDRLQAEGFSASIAPSLEAGDLDALHRARPPGRDVRIEMRNEAYETHVVRHANLVAVPREDGQRVLHDPAGRFRTVNTVFAPVRATAIEGDCAALLAAFDGRERYSAADSLDLAAREVIELEFAASAGAGGDSATWGVVLASRQSLLPTYLLYQAFSYFGTAAGDWLAAYERSDPAILRGTAEHVLQLGGIDVQVPDGNGDWRTAGVVRETGPLAADVVFLPLPGEAPPSRVRLRLARGAWRIDWVGLASGRESPPPLRLEPASVRRGDREDPDARERLVDPDRVLVTGPGDRYTLVYRLPGEASRYELFLDSRGYYLEWMRREWMAEEDRARAAALFLDPAGSLRRMAPEFKRAEAALDSAFWGSRYAGF